METNRTASVPVPETVPVKLNRARGKEREARLRVYKNALRRTATADDAVKRDGQGRITGT